MLRARKGCALSMTIYDFATAVGSDASKKRKTLPGLFIGASVAGDQDRLVAFYAVEKDIFARN